MKTYTRTDGSVVSNERRNGNGKLSWWLMTTFAGILIFGSLGWMTRLQQEASTTSLETAGLKASYADVVRRLTSIETKLDRILGWQKHLR